MQTQNRNETWNVFPLFALKQTEVGLTVSILSSAVGRFCGSTEGRITMVTLHRGIARLKNTAPPATFLTFNLEIQRPFPALGVLVRHQGLPSQGDSLLCSVSSPVAGELQAAEVALYFV